MAYNNPVPALSLDESDRKGQSKKDSKVEDYVFHKSVYFAFIDVLGFKQAFDDNRKDPKKEFAKAYQDVFNYYSLLLSKTNIVQPGFSQAGQTSDSLYYYTERIDYLAEFIKIYLHFSWYAMSKDVFFRGGIANGCLFVNTPYQFYGDCVIKAYLLEEKISKFPRIALDEKTYSDLSDYLKAEDGIGMLISDDKNGRYYLKPFVDIARTEVASITNLDISQIKSFKKKAIQKNIENGEDRFEFDERNYPKYHFLHDEINQFKGDFE